MANSGGRFWPTGSRPKAASSPTAPTPNGRETLIPAARDADLFIAEAYSYDRIVKNHLSLKTLEAHLPEIKPKRLILTHMSDDMLGRLDTLDYTRRATAWSSSCRGVRWRHASRRADRALLRMSVSDPHGDVREQRRATQPFRMAYGVRAVMHCERPWNTP